MDKQVNKLIKLLDNDMPNLIDFDELISGAYSRKKADAVAIQLNVLEKAALLTFERQEYGFRINLYDIDAIKNSQIV